MSCHSTKMMERTLLDQAFTVREAHHDLLSVATHIQNRNRALLYFPKEFGSKIVQSLHNKQLAPCKVQLYAQCVLPDLLAVLRIRHLCELVTQYAHPHVLAPDGPEMALWEQLDLCLMVAQMAPIMGDAALDRDLELLVHTYIYRRQQQCGDGAFGTLMQRYMDAVLCEMARSAADDFLCRG